MGWALAVASDGYLTTSPFWALSVASSGYLQFVEILIAGGPDAKGGERLDRLYKEHRPELEQLMREDEEMLAIIILATIYGVLR